MTSRARNSSLMKRKYFHLEILSPGADQDPVSENSVTLFVVERNYQNRNIFQRFCRTYLLMGPFVTIYTFKSYLTIPNPLSLEKTYAYFNAASHFCQFITFLIDWQFKFKKCKFKGVVFQMVFQNRNQIFLSVVIHHLLHLQLYLKLTKIATNILFWF